MILSISKKITLAIFIMSVTLLNAQTPNKAEDVSPLLIGESIPNEILKTVDGKDVSTKSILKKKPTVLIFYRGGWCPYCNLQLSGIVSIEQQIIDLGYQIVAISPDHYSNLKDTGAKNKLNYTLLSDPNGNLIKKTGIAFGTPLIIKGYAVAKGQKGAVSSVMPVPTVMVINKEQEILFEYINPNYKKRIESKMLLAVLKSLKNG